MQNSPPPSGWRLAAARHRPSQVAEIVLLSGGVRWLSAPPVSALMGWGPMSSASRGWLDSKLTDEVGGEQQAGDLAAGADGSSLPP